jgi:predicted nucleic acid-binding protein
VKATGCSVAIDTNILLYAQGAGAAGGTRHQQALDCVARLPPSRLALPVQVLGEFHRVLRRKFGFEAAAARNALSRWTSIYPTLDTTRLALDMALELCAEHSFDTWDALILAVVAEHRCKVLLTEDMQHGFVWRGVCLVNPFAAPAHPYLAALLD